MYSQFYVIRNRLLIVFFNIIWEVIDWDLIVVNIFHDLHRNQRRRHDEIIEHLTLFLKALNSEGVNESAFPMTGMTLTRGDSRRISSMSISLRLFDVKQTTKLNQ